MGHERGPAPAPEGRHVYGPDGTPLERVAANGTAAYVHADQLGSVRALTDAAGSVGGTSSFDPHGNPTGSTGTVSLPFGFAGEYRDAESGFIYLRARYYDPATAQFLSVDPVFALSLSRYGYVDGDPLNNVDPSGLLCLSVKCAVKAVKTVSAVVQVTANVVAVAAAVVPGGQAVAIAALSVSQAAGGLNALATCTQFVMGDGSGGECAAAAGTYFATAGIGNAVLTGGVKSAAEAGIQGGINVTGDLAGWALGYDQPSYNQNLWIGHPFEGAAYLPS